MLICFFVGGVLEAHPPSDSVTSLTVSMLIEPDRMRIISSGDHIHAQSPYCCWGLTFPQTSVEPNLLNTTCTRIADACRQRAIMGYIDVDFVTFIDPKTVRFCVLLLTTILLKLSNTFTFIFLLYRTNRFFGPLIWTSRIRKMSPSHHCSTTYRMVCSIPMNTRIRCPLKSRSSILRLEENRGDYLFV